MYFHVGGPFEIKDTLYKKTRFEEKKAPHNEKRVLFSKYMSLFCPPFGLLKIYQFKNNHRYRGSNLSFRHQTTRHNLILV